jgi:hypothetical protein
MAAAAVSRTGGRAEPGEGSSTRNSTSSSSNASGESASRAGASAAQGLSAAEVGAAVLWYKGLAAHRLPRGLVQELVDRGLLGGVLGCEGDGDPA